MAEAVGTRQGPPHSLRPPCGACGDFTQKLLGLWHWKRRTIAPKPGGLRRSRHRRTARDNLGGHRRVPVPKIRAVYGCRNRRYADPASASVGHPIRSFAMS